LVFLLIFFPFYVHADSKRILDPSQLAEQTQVVGRSIYKSIVASSGEEPTFGKLKVLKQAVNSSASKIEAVSLILKNRSLIQYYIDDVEVFFFIQFLLDNNLYWAASELLKDVEAENDQSLSAQASYLAGQYFFKRGEWDKAHRYLTVNNELRSDQQAAHANLMMGVAQQYLKNHRQAETYYKLIAPKSEFYPYAQLNSAIVSIRQGWWADSYRTINALLGNQKAKKNNEFVNRAYLVMGYGMLQKEYSRDSKEAFLNVEKKSRFAQKAMLGLGLSALAAEEFRYAANIFSLIKAQSNKSLALDESYLLFAYVQEQIGDDNAALEEYKKTLSYFQLRSRVMSDLAEPYSEFYSKALMAIKANQNPLYIADVSFDISEQIASYSALDYRFLVDLKTYLGSGGTSLFPTEPLSLLIKQHEALLIEQMGGVLNARRNALASYESQSRYAIARLLDRSQHK
jgi:hypothetical protein